MAAYTKIKSFSAKGLILAGLLVIGRTAPLIAQEDTEQEIAEHETPDQEMSDQEIADQDHGPDDSGNQDLEHESHESQAPHPEPGISAPENHAGETQETKPAVSEPKPAEPAADKATSESTAQPVGAPAVAKSAVHARPAGFTADQKKPQLATHAGQAQEVPALVLEETAPAKSMHAATQSAEAVAKPVVEHKSGQHVPALMSKNSSEQKSLLPAHAKSPARPTPQPRAPKERPEHVESEDEDLVGIDTVSLDDPQGNWLFKRIWWERAEKKIEKIRRLVNAVFESRVIFLAQRTDIDRNVLDPFYVSIGIGQGELTRILDELIARLEKEREKEGTLSNQERDILQELRKEESALKQMKKDVESVTRIDHDIDEALNTLFEQINKVREYEGDAWDNFKEIARVLNDIKARELYYTMDIIAKNIEDIQAYIQQDYARHFNQLSITAKQQIERLKKSIETMRERGLDLGKQLELLEQQEKMRASGKKLEAEEEDEQEPEEEKGFFGRYIMAPLSYVGSGLKALFDGVVSVVTWPIKYVTGGTTGDDSVQEVKEEDED